MITLKKFKNIIKNLSYLMAFVVLFTAFFTIMPEKAVAVDLAGAKSAGFVGEKPDGYLGIVNKNAPPDIHKLVQNVNSKRRAKYLSIAKKNNQELRVVESLVGKKLINGTKPGNYYMNQGKWAKK